MMVPCEGGMLDGQQISMDVPSEVIHQSGMFVLRVHRPYPKREGEKVTQHLHTYWEDYDLTVTEDGPVYRCRAPFAGTVTVGDERLECAEDGGYDVWLDRDGKPHARRP